MRNLVAALSWFFSDDDVGRVIGLIIWVTICVVLVPCLWRCVCKRPRYIDPLLAAALVLTLNRVAFGVQSFVKSDTLADLCRWSGIIGAMFYLFVVWDYLRPERV